MITKPTYKGESPSSFAQTFILLIHSIFRITTIYSIPFCCFLFIGCKAQISCYDRSMEVNHSAICYNECSGVCGCDDKTFCNGCIANSEGKEFEENKSCKKSTTINASPTTSPYPLTIKQPDNTTIQVLGKGNIHNPYVETIDGFTLLKNEDKIYEYAVLGLEGQLELSGIKGHDPDKRTYQEKEFLKNIEKHLRNK